MKVGIIGADNMGGAIARGLVQGHYIKVQDIIVTNPSTPKLEKLKAEYPAMQVSTSNRDAADADIVSVAVKPWKVEDVLKPLHVRHPQILVSVAARLTFEDLAHFVDPEMPMFRGDSEYRHLFACKHDADSLPERFGATDLDDA